MPAAIGQDLFNDLQQGTSLQEELQTKYQVNGALDATRFIRDLGALVASKDHLKLSHDPDFKPIASYTLSCAEENEIYALGLKILLDKQAVTSAEPDRACLHMQLQRLLPAARGAIDSDLLLAMTTCPLSTAIASLKALAIIPVEQRHPALLGSLLRLFKDTSTGQVALEHQQLLLDQLLLIPQDKRAAICHQMAPFLNETMAVSTRCAILEHLTPLTESECRDLCKHAASLCQDSAPDDAILRSLQLVANVARPERKMLVAETQRLMAGIGTDKESLAIFQSLANILSQERTHFVEEALTWLPYVSAVDDKVALLTASSTLSSLERKSFISQVAPLLTVVTPVADKALFSQKLASLSQVEREDALGLIEQFWTTDNSQAIYPWLMAILSLPVNEREAVLRQAKPLLAHVTAGKDLEDVLQAFRRLPIKSRDSFASQMASILATVDNASDRAAFLQVAGDILESMRADFIHQTEPLLSHLTTTAEKVALLKALSRCSPAERAQLLLQAAELAGNLADKQMSGAFVSILLTIPVSQRSTVVTQFQALFATITEPEKRITTLQSFVAMSELARSYFMARVPALLKPIADPADRAAFLQVLPALYHEHWDAFIEHMAPHVAHLTTQPEKINFLQYMAANLAFPQLTHSQTQRKTLQALTAPYTTGLQKASFLNALLPLLPQTRTAICAHAQPLLPGVHPVEPVLFAIASIPQRTRAELIAYAKPFFNGFTEGRDIAAILEGFTALQPEGRERFSELALPLLQSIHPASERVKAFKKMHSLPLDRLQAIVDQLEPLSKGPISAQAKLKMFYTLANIETSELNAICQATQSLLPAIESASVDQRIKLLQQLKRVSTAELTALCALALPFLEGLKNTAEVEHILSMLQIITLKADASAIAALKPFLIAAKRDTDRRAILTAFKNLDPAQWSSIPTQVSDATTLVQTINQASFSQILPPTLEGDKAHFVRQIWPLIAMTDDSYAKQPIAAQMLALSDEERQTSVPLLVPILQKISVDEEKVSLLKALVDLPAAKRDLICQQLAVLWKNQTFTYFASEPPEQILNILAGFTTEHSVVVCQAISPWLDRTTDPNTLPTLLQTVSELLQADGPSAIAQLQPLLALSTNGEQVLSILQACQSLPKQTKLLLAEQAPTLLQASVNANDSVAFIQTLGSLPPSTWKDFVLKNSSALKHFSYLSDKALFLQAQAQVVQGQRLPIDMAPQDFLRNSLPAHLNALAQNIVVIPPGEETEVYQLTAALLPDMLSIPVVDRTPVLQVLQALVRVPRTERAAVYQLTTQLLPDLSSKTVEDRLSVLTTIAKEYKPDQATSGQLALMLLPDMAAIDDVMQRAKMFQAINSVPVQERASARQLMMALLPDMPSASVDERAKLFGAIASIPASERESVQQSTVALLSHVEGVSNTDKIKLLQTVESLTTARLEICQMATSLLSPAQNVPVDQLVELLKLLHGLATERTTVYQQVLSITKNATYTPGSALGKAICYLCQQVQQVTGTQKEKADLMAQANALCSGIDSLTNRSNVLSTLIEMPFQQRDAFVQQALLLLKNIKDENSKTVLLETLALISATKRADFIAQTAPFLLANFTKSTLTAALQQVVDVRNAQRSACVTNVNYFLKPTSSSKDIQQIFAIVRALPSSDKQRSAKLWPLVYRCYPLLYLSNSYLIFFAAYFIYLKAHVLLLYAEIWLCYLQLMMWSPKMYCCR